MTMAAPYRLHGVWLSGPTYKVGLMLALTGQKFDYEFVNLREGAHQKPEYKAKNRFAVVPCLTVTATGRNLCQAAAILGYLAQTTGKFAGASADEQQEIREWMLWSYDRLIPPVYRLRAAKLGFRKFDPATSEMYTAEGKAALKLLDDHLKGRSWVVGNGATIADIDLYGAVHYAPDAGFSLADYPNIQAWLKRFEALPGYGKPEAILPKETRAAA
jgi:glutathione S-transferase